jgi:C-terminal processing protease CtpA/Prc
VPYVVNTFHWREGNRVVEFRTTELGDLVYGAHKPVFVLTSPGTFSGGEELSYDLQVLERAVVVGEVTGGGANPGGPVPLGHQFVVNMPSGRPVNPVTGCGPCWSYGLDSAKSPASMIVSLAGST